jgi:hypothetical protein
VSELNIRVALRHPFTPLLLLFVAFRLMMLVTFLPEDLTHLGDYPYYYALAQLSDEGRWPFIGYWSEHAPLFPFLSTLIYRLSLLTPRGGYEAYVYLFGCAMLAFDVGSLWLLMRLGRRLWGEELSLRLGWTWALLFAPLIYSWWTFEGMTAFFILLALELLLAERDGWSAVAAGLGVLTKLVPVVLVAAVMRARPLRRWLRYGLIALGVVLAVLLPLVLAGGPYAMAFFRSTVARSSYETVWALIDGNRGTGMLLPLVAHLDPAQAGQATGHAARLPEWLKSGAFGLLYLWLLWRADLHDAPRRLVAFVALSLVLFFLWSKGWSPQWQVFLFPLLLLALPYQRALLWVLTLSAVNLAEWPVLLAHQLDPWLWVTVLLRTALFIGLGYELWRVVRPSYSVSGRLAPQ